MADNRKEQERQELHSKLWAICNDLRGSINGWDFKQYVLGMMFYRLSLRILPHTSLKTSAKPGTRLLTTLIWMTQALRLPENT